MLARRTEEECRPLLLSMFRVLKELLHYCEEHSRGDLAEEVAEALSMCQADFTKLKDRLHSGAAAGGKQASKAKGERVALSKGSTSPLAIRTEAPCDTPEGPASPPHDPLADSPNSNSHMLQQLEALDMEQLQEAARYFSTTGQAPLMPRRVHEAMYLQIEGVTSTHVTHRRVPGRVVRGVGCNAGRRQR